MPLHGTFDVLGFADVLELLAGKAATGRLHVRSRSIGANVYLEDGLLVGADVGEHVNTSTVDVRSRLEEVCFELLAAGRGSFEFFTDTTGMGPPTMRLEVDEVLDRAHQRLAEWREIQKVIPSLDLHPSVVADLEGDQVTLSREQWRLLMTLDGRRTIRAIARLLARSDYDVCRTVKSLIEVGAVEIDAPSRSFPWPPEPRVIVDEAIEEPGGGVAADAEGDAGATRPGTDHAAAMGRPDWSPAAVALGTEHGVAPPGASGEDEADTWPLPSSPEGPLNGGSKGHRQGIIRLGRKAGSHYAS